MARLNYLDALRALLMLLGVPYHAALLYRQEGWVMTADNASGFVSFVGAFLHTFRMQAFFMIAGYFAWIILGRRSTRTWLADRSMRLLIPMVFGILLITPLQHLVIVLDRPVDDIMTAWFEQITRPGEGRTMQMWFLRDLFLMCLLLALATWLHLPIQAVGDAAERAGRRLGTLPVLVLAALAVGVLLTLANMVLYGGFLPISGSLAWNISRTGVYFPFFVLGVVLASNAAIFDGFLQWRGWLVPVSIAAMTAMALLDQAGETKSIGSLAGPLVGLLGSWLVMATARRWLDTPSPAIKLAVEAAMTVYLFHILFIFLFATLLMPNTDLSPVLEWSLITLLSMAASLAAFLLLRRSRILFFLFNGTTRGARTPATTVPG